MIARCVIETVFPDADAAKAALSAVSHEGGVGNRSKVLLSQDGGTLRIDISADDVVALRAAANAFLRALQAFEAIDNVDR
jgi:tRNA threonylcarbamoyladenosine modification (KEOPS) complex  Pcc1 subunit